MQQFYKLSLLDHPLLEQHKHFHNLSKQVEMFHQDLLLCCTIYEMIRNKSGVHSITFTGLNQAKENVCIYIYIYEKR